MIYDGSPAQRLPSIANLVFVRLSANHRCLYLNSPPMVAGLRSYLAAAGVDVAQEVRRGSLVLSSDQSHLVNGYLNVANMLAMLEEAVRRALSDGYQGLYATGDMTWEFGPERNFEKLLEYEQGLEELFERFPHLSGVCQYHQATLPVDVVRSGLFAHRGVCINETLSRINPHYRDPELLRRVPAEASVAQVSERLSQLN
jgi:MEDS: MEthanogen/methylotroph, DcmR Sensory domain